MLVSAVYSHSNYVNMIMIRYNFVVSCSLHFVSLQSSVQETHKLAVQIIVPDFIMAALNVTILQMIFNI